MADTVFDIAIVGAGPAGLSAALTARVRNKTVALFEHMDFSPKLQKAHAINNYPGLPMLAGKDLMKQLSEHCLSAGPTLIREKVTNVFAGDTFTLLTPNNTYEAKAVVLAIGVSNSAMLAGEKDLIGRGVSYCATCDGMLYRGKPVAVIAYTEEGEHDANFLGEICPTVYFIPQYKTEFQPSQPTVQVLKARPQAVLGTGEVTGTADGRRRAEGRRNFHPAPVRPGGNAAAGAGTGRSVREGEPGPGHQRARSIRGRGLHRQALADRPGDR